MDPRLIMVEDVVAFAGSVTSDAVSQGYSLTMERCVWSELFLLLCNMGPARTVITSSWLELDSYISSPHHDFIQLSLTPVFGVLLFCCSFSICH